jgi:hypothetical protein
VSTRTRSSNESWVSGPSHGVSSRTPRSESTSSRVRRRVPDKAQGLCAVRYRWEQPSGHDAGQDEMQLLSPTTQGER